MRILITGGAGFLGSHLTEAWLERGDDVTVLDPASDVKIRHLRANPKFRVIRESVLERDILEGLVAWSDLVYHLAAVVGVEHYVGDPYQVLTVNINGTQEVLAAAFRHAKKVVFSSTSEIYGRNTAVPFHEDSDRVLGSTLIDRWCYATSKAAGEHFCFAFARMGLPVVVLRYFNVYGPRLDQMDRGRVVTIFMGQLLRGEPLTVIGDGSQTRAFTYVDDAVRATVEAGLRREVEGRAINVGSEEEVAIRELAARMIKLSGSSSRLISVAKEAVYDQGYEDIPRRVPSVRRMRELLGVRARVTLDDGLGRTIEWFKRQYPCASTSTRGAGSRRVSPGCWSSFGARPFAPRSSSPWDPTGRAWRSVARSGPAFSSRCGARIRSGSTVSARSCPARSCRHPPSAPERRRSCARSPTRATRSRSTGGTTWAGRTGSIAWRRRPSAVT